MKKIKIVLVLLALSVSAMVYAQKLSDHSDFHGAEATGKEYKALYILNQSGDKKIRTVLKNINNVLEDPRLKGKLQIELIAFGDGTDLYRKSNHYDTLLTPLRNKGVIFAQCENTMRERHISRDELWPFVSYVPSANGEIIIRQYQGWAILHL